MGNGKIVIKIVCRIWAIFFLVVTHDKYYDGSSHQGFLAQTDFPLENTSCEKNGFLSCAMFGTIFARYFVVVSFKKTFGFQLLKSKISKKNDKIKK